MLNNMRKAVSVVLLGALMSMGLAAEAQRPYRASDSQIRVLLNRIATRTSNFQNSLDNWLSNSQVSNTRAEDNIRNFSSDFQNSLDRLRDNFNRRQSTMADAQDLLDRASRIDAFLTRRRPDARTDRDWANLRTDLNTLGSYYGATWRPYNNNYSNQSGGAYNGYPNQGYPNSSGNVYNRLTGTYSLDVSRSDDPRAAAERASRNMSYSDRQAVLDSMTARLESPDQLAIDKRGQNVAIASTRAPQFSFVADGRERVETGPNGNTIRARATLNGDQLIITTNGDRNNDFTVTFDPIDNGQRLTVIRRISNPRLSAPVVVQSVYNRVSDVAQLNLYNGTPGYPSQTTPNGDFVIPNNTQVVAVLNTDLSTQTAQNNDRFTMTVRSPYEYQGATIEGYISNVQRSGKITGRSSMNLNFDTIRLRNGRTYRFAGILDSVRTSNGETVRVDNEGTVEDKDSRGTTTAQRAAIGTAVGALIGAIAGGGKGAAIGAIVGAGAGAGSVYVQGRDDLQLLSGTEVTIRSTGPQSQY
jgi:hypothetical protein